MSGNSYDIGGEMKIIKKLITALKLAVERAIYNGDRLVEAGFCDMNRGQFEAYMSDVIQEATKVVETRSVRCQTTHYACDCVLERMRKLEVIAEEANELLLQCQSRDIKHGERTFCRDCGYPDGTHKHNCAVGELWKALAALEVDSDA